MASIIVSGYEFIREKAEKSHLLYNVKRALLPLIIASFVLSGLLFSSTIAYFVFYWSYIPSVGITRDVHLQFSRESPPWGSVDLGNANLLSSQPYKAFIEIELPRTPNNIDIGNFMISLSLVTPSNEVLATSSRPAILTYTSPLISTSLTILNSPLLITGFKKESETLLVQLMERFEFPSSARASRPRTAQIQISPAESNRIQIYSAKLILVAQFEGIRWFMYSHRIVAFLLFTSLFFISSSLFAALTWFIFSLRASHRGHSTGDIHRNSSVSTLPPNIEKEEHDDDLSISTAVGRSTLPLSGRVFPRDSGTVKEEVKEEGSVSSAVVGRTDDESGELDGEEADVDDDIETIERNPTSETSF